MIYIIIYFAAVAVIAFWLGRRVRQGHGGVRRAIVHGLLTVLLSAALFVIAWGVRNLEHALFFVGFSMLALVFGEPLNVLVVLLALAVGALAGWAGWRLGGSTHDATN